MEFHSYARRQCARAGAAAVRAMERLMPGYGIPEQAQPHMVGSSPVATLCAGVPAAARRPQWHESGGVSEGILCGQKARNPRLMRVNRIIVNRTSTCD
jgi:hypothetical protein